MKKVIPLFLAIAAIVFALFLLKPTPDKSTETPKPEISEKKRPDNLSVRLPIPAVDTGFSPFYLAVDKGFFEKAGLAVDLKPGSPELNPIKMVSSGTDSFGLIGGPELLFNARSKDAPVVGVALLGRDADLAGLITLKSSGLTQLSQLQGKRVGFFYGHITTDILHMLFQKEGLKVTEVDTGFDYGQLISGKIDAQWAFKTTAGINLPAKGIEINFISAADYDIKTHSYTVIANAKFIAENPDIAKRFVGALIEATQYSLAHPEEAIVAAMKRDPNFKEGIGKQQLPLYNKAILNQARIGEYLPEDQKTTVKQMQSANLLPVAFEIEGAFNPKFVEDFYAKKP